MRKPSGSSKQSGVIAVSETTASTGLISWWRLRGSIDRQELLEAWSDAGFDAADLPRHLGASVALRRALGQLFVKADVDLQRISATENRPGGFAVVQVSQVDDGDAIQDAHFETLLKVWLEDGIVHVSSTRRTEAEEVLKLRKMVWDAFQAELQKVDAHDLSSWLVRQVEAVNGVRLREGGGVYFVPETQTATWRKVAAVLESVSSSSVYEIPALRSDRAVSAIIDALIAEAQQEISRMNETLDQISLGQRALSSREKACSDLIRKVAEYEKLLGVKVGDLHEAMSALQARLIEEKLVTEE